MERLMISKKILKRFLIEYQGLGSLSAYHGKEGVKAFLMKVGCIQYDPLNVVGRNADLTLQSRVEGYKMTFLHDLLYVDRALVDGWDKQMSIYNVEDFRYMDRVRKSMSKSTIRTLEYRKSDKALEYIDEVKEALKGLGPTKPGAIDFGRVEKGVWGHGKVSSTVMDYLFHTGELGIADKIGTQKIYDFIDNLIDPLYLQNRNEFVDEEAFFEWYTKRRIGSIGMYWSRNGDGWLGKFLSKKDIRQPAISRLIDKKEILEVTVEGFKETFYMRAQDEPLLKKVIEIEDGYEARWLEFPVKFIAPLDNLIWDRKLLREAFDFDYTWEVYKPVSKRLYGYYVLPVLKGDRFIARFEPDHVKGGKTLKIKNWWWEKDIEVTDQLVKQVMDAFEKFRVYLDVNEIETDIETLLLKTGTGQD